MRLDEETEKEDKTKEKEENLDLKEECGICATLELQSIRSKIASTPIGMPTMNTTAKMKPIIARPMGLPKSSQMTTQKYAI
jgi:hypothetical protein